MFSFVYKKFVIDYPKLTLFLLAILIGFSFYNAKNFNLDASSDALLLEGDKDLKFLRENSTFVQEQLASRGIDVDTNYLKNLAEKIKVLEAKKSLLQEESNKIGKIVGKKIKEGLDPISK